ncbi:MAG: hypothetical protein A2234_02360 [Elusimicrobia bacterium RIFOXYA2_FULL_58_8]|nr:MAG: hypothetical protein A2285_02325 [Elusimicrobia bacterium RIFOXYA12_FULL_57_11]OGS13156.1 MAG: hypothetical protein A2234_02360 [Elusimicrobia bacterium RIFOXYA2_FULL_58_8]
MQNEESDPRYTVPPDGPDRLTAPPGADSRTAATFNLTAIPAPFLAAGLLLVTIVLYLFWPAARPPETAVSSQASSNSQPKPPAPVSGDELQPGNLTPPVVGLMEESLAPPLPGLLMPQLTLESVSYTGPDPGAEALDKETEEDRAGCNTGDMLKCMRLGGRYFAGHGVERNPERAFPLINKACAGGIAEACTMQGVMQTSGYGTALNIPAGIKLYHKTCGAGDMMGCTMLGITYLDGKYVPQDVPRGLELIQKACYARIAAACSALGMLYAKGNGVPLDTAEAERLLNLACGLNEKNACQLYRQQVQLRLAAENRK